MAGCLQRTGIHNFPNPSCHPIPMHMCTVCTGSFAPCSVVETLKVIIRFWQEIIGKRKRKRKRIRTLCHDHLVLTSVLLVSNNIHQSWSHVLCVVKMVNHALCCYAQSLLTGLTWAPIMYHADNLGPTMRHRKPLCHPVNSLVKVHPRWV